MHSPEFITAINEAAAKLGIKATHFPTNWAIELKKNGLTKFIVGYTLPLNDSASYKIARSKNLCCEILNSHEINNVPHKLLLSPTILLKRKKTVGNNKSIEEFIHENNFPFLIKRNNSSKGDGVFLIQNEVDLENVLSLVYSTDSTLCLSPYRKITGEYRNIVLNNECMLSFEKQIPCVIGNGESLIIELLADYLKTNKNSPIKLENIFDASLLTRLKEKPKKNERIYFQWKHNASFGMKYEIINNERLKLIASKAAQAINAKFVSVDIIESEKYGLEILEINASVVLNSFSSISTEYYTRTVDIYTHALNEVFSQ
ncbi:MAG: cphA [Ferruginibacter sp.]|nr:cphA [Ferruginibacter sp.]